MSSDEEDDDLAELCFSREPPPSRKRPKLDVEAIEQAGWRDDRGSIEEIFVKDEATARKKDAQQAQAAAAQAAAAAEVIRRAENVPAAPEEPPSEPPPRNKRAAAAGKHATAPRRKDGAKLSFNEKERRSRTMRGENDFNQEQKRILRQKTDGWCMGY